MSIQVVGYHVSLTTACLASQVVSITEGPQVILPILDLKPSSIANKLKFKPGRDQDFLFWIFFALWNQEKCFPFALLLRFLECRELPLFLKISVILSRHLICSKQPIFCMLTDSKALRF